MIKIIPGDACVTLVIDRPERRNALTNAMYTDLDLALQSAQSEAGCNAIILTGSGGHFTAGNDLSEFQAERAAGDSPALAFLRTLAGIDVPVIAAVEGRAVGVGVTLLQHCDFVYAADDARSEEHTSELQSLMRISYSCLCLKKKKTTNNN